MGGFFRLVEFDVDDIAGHANVFEGIRRGDVHGMLVHGIFRQALLDRIVSRLQAHEPAFLKTWFPAEFNSWFYGRNLNLADPALTGYFDEASQFQQDLRALFPAGQGIEDYLADILGKLDSGRPFSAAPGPEINQSYMFTTLRCHEQGGYIPPHIDYEYVRRRSYQHLRGIIDPHICSFVLPLSVPESGGNLLIYERKVDANHVHDPTSVDQDHDLSGLQAFTVPFRAGSLFVFDSGRFLHSVSPVQGPSPRWTACSFMALSRDHSSMYCWG